MGLGKLVSKAFGGVGNLITGIIGGAAVGFGLKSMKKVRVDAPSMEADVKKNRKARGSLVKTAGGSAGEQLMEGQVKKRDTFFGN
jgi:hypothetical protein